VSVGVWVALGLAGAIGAPLRYLVDLAVTAKVSHRLSIGTLAVNVSGSFLLGLITGLALYHGLSASAKIVFGTGLCGAYTTFSTFTYETVVLAGKAERRGAVLYVIASLCISGLAAAGGLALGAW
jgi:fluoride exporter